MTQEQIEKEKGRVAVWLDPDDIKFLANEWRKIPENANQSSKETWGRIAFRLMTSLHENGIKYDPKFPNETDKYKLT